MGGGPECGNSRVTIRAEAAKARPPGSEGHWGPDPQIRARPQILAVAGEGHNTSPQAWAHLHPSGH